MPLLQLLGSAKLMSEGILMDIPPKQALLLGSYLAYKEDWVSRDELLHLFWPDEPERIARHNLSQLLYHCKKQIWMQGLETERGRVRWLIETDVKQFQEALGNGTWHKASEYYRGRLLANVNADYAPQFEIWLEQTRESLHNSWRGAVLNYASQLESEKNYAKASELLNDVLNQDSLAEDILQTYMRCCLENNMREQALKAYRQFCKELKKELDMEPLEPTQNLANKIRSISSLNKTKPLEKPILLSFPNYQSPFIGRDLELAELSGLIQNKEIRLVNLLGPGGIGKSRLSIQAAYENIKYFADGAVFISLASIEHEDFIIPKILESLELQPSPEQNSKDFLFKALKDKEMLLVLDNLEHLGNAVELILDMLEQIANISLLISSRQILDIKAEVIYDLKGLSYPKKPEDSLEDYDAVRLFLRMARRTHISFTLNKQNKQGIAKICQVLNGSPLGIELAATWVRLLSPHEIATEIEKNLDLLATKQKDLAKRHQSMQAVLEHSWLLLSDSEQVALKKLALFSGGFSRNAAQEVAKADLRTLLSLVNKSLLQRSQNSRFERLMVVQQFCLKKLKQDDQQYQQIQQKHAEYFAKFIKTYQSELNPEQEAKYLELIKQEHSNIRAALNYLISNKAEDLALEMAKGLSRFWWLHGHYQEGRDFSKQVLKLSNKKTSLRATVIGKLGNLARLCEDFGEARAWYNQSLEIKQLLKDERGMAASFGNLAMLSRIEGDYKSARQLLEKSLAIYKTLADKQQIANGLNNLAAIAKSEQRHLESLELNKQSLKIAKEIGNQFIAARCLGNIAIDALDNKNYKNALSLAKQSLAIFKKLDYKVGIAVGKQILGDISLGMKDYKKTREYYLKALKSFKNIEDSRGIAEVLASLAELAHAESKPKRALKYCILSQNLHKNLGISQMPDSKQSLDKIISTSQKILGISKWQKLISKAKEFTVEEAYQYALSYPISANKVLQS